MSLDLNCIKSNRLIVSGGDPAVDKVLVCKSASGACAWDIVPGSTNIVITERTGETAVSRTGMWQSDGVNQSEMIYNFTGQEVVVYGMIDVEISEPAGGATGDFIMAAPIAPSGPFVAGSVTGTGSVSGLPSFSVTILPQIGTANIRFAGGALTGAATSGATTMTYTYSYTLTP